MPNEDWVFWLAVTNIAMVVVVLLVGLVLGYAVISEVVSRRRKLHAAAGLDKEMNTMLRHEFTHSLPVPELGMTLADGGEKAEPSPAPATEKKQR
jgi:hypothetical protein